MDLDAAIHPHSVTFHTFRSLWYVDTDSVSLPLQSRMSTERSADMRNRPISCMKRKAEFLRRASEAISSVLHKASIAMRSNQTRLVTNMAVEGGTKDAQSSAAASRQCGSCVEALFVSSGRGEPGCGEN